VGAKQKKEKLGVSEKLQWLKTPTTCNKHNIPKITQERGTEQRHIYNLRNRDPSAKKKEHITPQKRKRGQ